jgi:hypothetical protein
MNKLIIIFFFSFLNYSLTANEKNVLEEAKSDFTDTVRSSKIVNNKLEIVFKMHAASYYLTKENPKYHEYVKLIEKSSSKNSKLNFIFVYPTMEVQEVKEIKE